MYQRQIYTPPLTYVNKILIGLIIGLFLLNSITTSMFEFSSNFYLWLSPPLFFAGFIFQLLSYPFVGDSLMAVLFNSLILWFVGSELEYLWGRRNYLIAILCTAVGGGLFYLVISAAFLRGTIYPLFGMTGIVSALCLAYGILYPNRTFSIMLIFPIKARYFCFILIALELYRSFFTPDRLMAVGVLGAMAAMVVFLGFKAKHLMNFDSIRNNPLSGLLNKFKRERAKKRLKVIPGEKASGEDKPPKYWQ